jgi:hypothetical protein
MKKFIDKTDVQLYLGTGLIAYGIWHIYKPGAFIFVGIAFIVSAYLDAATKRIIGG